MHSRGRDVERLRRVSEADAIHAESINCPATACSWREVKGRNSRHVLAGHKRACCFFAGQYEPTGSGSAVDFGTFCDGVREEDDGSIADMDGSVVVHEDLHEDYIIQRTVQGTVPVVKKKNIKNECVFWIISKTMKGKNLRCQLSRTKIWILKRRALLLVT